MKREGKAVQIVRYGQRGLVERSSGMWTPLQHGVNFEGFGLRNRRELPWSCLSQPHDFIVNRIYSVTVSCPDDKVVTSVCGFQEERFLFLARDGGCQVKLGGEVLKKRTSPGLIKYTLTIEVL